jgi:hypothetical protein
VPVGAADGDRAAVPLALAPVVRDRLAFRGEELETAAGVGLPWSKLRRGRDVDRLFELMFDHDRSERKIN